MPGVPNTVELRVGEDFTFELPGLGTAGYVWQETVHGPTGVIEVSWHRGFTPGTEPSAVGVSAPEVATIRALGRGEVTVLLRQVRPWERDKRPLNEHAVVVRVAPRLDR